MCFTEFVQDPELRSNLGLYYICLSALMILTNLTLLTVVSCKACKQKRKMKKHAKIKKEQQDKIKAKEEAKDALEK